MKLSRLFIQPCFLFLTTASFFILCGHYVCRWIGPHPKNPSQLLCRCVNFKSSRGNFEMCLSRMHPTQEDVGSLSSVNDVTLTCMARILRGMSSLYCRMVKCHVLILIKSSKANSSIKRPSVQTWTKITYSVTLHFSSEMRYLFQCPLTGGQAAVRWFKKEETCIY